jgi:ketosteroid isomerase-like protein
VTVTAEALEALKEAYRIWSMSKGENFTPWLALMADDFESGSFLNGGPGLAFSRERRGKADMIGYFEDLQRDWRMICHVADEFLVDRDRVVVLIRTTWQNRRSGKIIDSPTAHLWQFKDGKALRKFDFGDSLAWTRAAEAG